MEKELHDFVILLHPRPPSPRRRWRLRRVAMPVLTALMLAGVGGAVWLVGPRIGDLLRVPAAAALITALPPARPPQPAPQARAETVPIPPAISASPAVVELAALAPSAPAAVAPPAPPPPQIAATPEPVVETAAALPAWLKNAVPAPAKDARPRVAVVIDDLGLDRRRSERAIALPGPLTLSFLPYADDLPRQAEAARRAGHELLVHVPMEPLGKPADTGPNQLEVGMTGEDMLRRLRWDLSRFEGYVGINNHMGSRFTRDADALRPVMQELSARGLLFLDSRTVAKSAGMEMAREYRVPHAGRDVFLDVELTSPAIAAALAELERVARRTGSAIAIGHPHDQTLDALERWLREVSAKGLVLVPVSAIVRERGGEG